MRVMRAARWLVIGVAVLGLSASYHVLVSAFRILALPRFEIPYVEPGMRGTGCFGHYDPNEWLALALAALGLSWAPLPWGNKGRGCRSLLARCLVGLAILTTATGFAWLAVVGGGVRAILGTVRGWHSGNDISHPGFHYFNYEVLLSAAQLGLGIMALALSLLSLSARLQHSWQFRTEALTAARAALLLVLGAALSVRSAWLNDSGCFPLWPALRRDAPESWDGLWTTSIAFYAGCLLLAFVGWPAARRRAWTIAPVALSAIYLFNHGYWGPQCTCQAIDVPSLPVTAMTTSRYPVARDWSFGPSQAVQLNERGVSWRGEQFENFSAFLSTLSHETQRRRELAKLISLPAAPESLVLRLAPGALVEQVRETARGARIAGFTGITFELGSDPWPLDVGWGIQVPTVNLMRIPVRFADDCSCQLELGPEQTAAAWLPRAEANLTQGVCCLSAAGEARTAPYKEWLSCTFSGRAAEQNAA